jgi:capsular polysaccharide biosynthesis protein
MKIDRLKIANGFTRIGMTTENASDLANTIGEAYDDAEKEMASLKDLEIIAAKSDARINAAINRQIIWIIGVAFTVIGVMIALKLWS